MSKKEEGKWRRPLRKLLEKPRPEALRTRARALGVGGQEGFRSIREMELGGIQ